jgi:hypothetical protein
LLPVTKVTAIYTSHKELQCKKIYYLKTFYHLHPSRPSHAAVSSVARDYLAPTVAAVFSFGFINCGGFVPIMCPYNIVSRHYRRGQTEK